MTDVVPLDMTADELLAVAATVESRSAHPMARTIVDAVGLRGLRW